MSGKLKTLQTLNNMGGGGGRKKEEVSVMKKGKMGTSRRNYQSKLVLVCIGFTFLTLILVEKTPANLLTNQMQ